MARHVFTLEQLRTFVAVADAGSMTRAAETLYLTQGAVTQQVRNFERALGLQLLERVAGGVRLTGAGAEVAESCREALASIDRVRGTASGLAALQGGSLRLGASPAAASHYLPPFLERFSAGHPAVSINVLTENTPRLAARVAAGVLDCAIVEGPIEERGLEVTVVTTDRVVLVARADSPLARLRRPDARALSRHCYLGREAGSSIEYYARLILGSAYGRSRRIEFGHMAAARGALLAGLGYSVLPLIAIRGELDRGRVVCLPWKSVDRSISAVRRPGPGSVALEAFWGLLQDAQAAPAVAGGRR